MNVSPLLSAARVPLAGLPRLRSRLGLATFSFLVMAGTAFAAEHGSWNRAKRVGYEVVRLPMKNGHATGEYEDFLTGFVTPDGKVWGRPVGVAVAKDGSLFVTDDGTKTVWHVSYTGNRASAK